MKKNILVFPCGSEIGLEIHRSLRHSIHFNVIGASSVADHGCFVFENYIGNIPYITDRTFISVIKKIIIDYKIDAVYPTMDAVIAVLKDNEELLGCPVVSSKKETVDLCLSKKETYSKLYGKVGIPQTFSADSTLPFPIFCKPNIGYGSRGAQKIANREELDVYLLKYPDPIISELLIGEEYTVDCFSDKNRVLQFMGVRTRSRILNGISVGTDIVNDETGEFSTIINAINNEVHFRGAWFVQLKRNANGELILLEVAARFAGSSSLYRGKGINFAMLSLFDIFDYPVTLFTNSYHLKMDRALDVVFKFEIEYDVVYCDFDDCLLLENKFINTELISFLFKCINKGIRIILLTRHRYNINESLEKYRLQNIFDEIIHIKDQKTKAEYITKKKAIFIDDSFSERKNVHDRLNIPVFGMDLIQSL